MPSRARSLLLVLLPLARATAFVPRGGVRHHQPKGGTLERVSTMPSLRARGGAAKSKLSATAATADAAEDGEKMPKLAASAIRSIQYCCKMCFFSVFADLLTTLIDGDIWHKISGPGAGVGWADCLDLFDSTSLLLFGGGLWKISQLYLGSLTANESMGHEKLLDLFRTMRMIWGVLALNLGLTAVSMTVRLPTHRKNDLFGLLGESTASAKQLAAGAVAILGMLGAIVQRKCTTTAQREAAAYRKERGISAKRADEVAVLREEGFFAYRNQAACAAVFLLMAILRWLKWMASYDGKIVGHIFKASEFLTPFAVGTLLFTLNHNLLRAAIAAVAGEGRGGGTNDGIYNDLFVAQASFYNKVAETLKGATIALLLPYVAAPLVPPLLRTLNEIPFFAKLFERFGVQV